MKKNKKNKKITKKLNKTSKRTQNKSSKKRIVLKSKIKNFDILKAIYFFVIMGTLIIILNVSKINLYWIQTYHEDSYLAKFQDSSILKFGSKVSENFEAKIIESKKYANDVLIFLNNYFVRNEKAKKAAKKLDENQNGIIVVTKNIFDKAFKQPKFLDLSVMKFYSEHNFIIPKFKFPVGFDVVDNINFVNNDKNMNLTLYNHYFSFKVHKNDVLEILPWTANLNATKAPKYLQKQTDKIIAKKTINQTAQTLKTIDNILQILNDAVVNSDKNEIDLKLGDVVFFAGDSLMQGVAPHLKSTLYKLYKIKSIDLSKQSTGLSYPGFFNWPKTINDTFVENKNISLIIVMLGPNDPWSFPDKTKLSYLKFKTAEWEAEYCRRISVIFNIAKEHNSKVIWVGAPNMKQQKLREQVRYLDTLYQDEAAKFGGIYLDVNDVLGNKFDNFTNFIKLDNRTVKVRTDDGIHFTIIGQRQIAKKILELIKFSQINRTVGL